MEAFEAVAKPWGNSLGVTIPREVVKKMGLKPQRKVKLFVVPNRPPTMRKLFGTLKFDKPTQQIMDEIDEGYD
jgi:antitoxin component of MazEF toxin-antitoxin module